MNGYTWSLPSVLQSESFKGNRSFVLLSESVTSYRRSLWVKSSTCEYSKQMFLENDHLCWCTHFCYKLEMHIAPNCGSHMPDFVLSSHGEINFACLTFTRKSYLDIEFMRFVEFNMTHVKCSYHTISPTLLHKFSMKHMHLIKKYLPLKNGTIKESQHRAIC